MCEIKGYLIPKENIKYISIYKDGDYKYIIVYLNDDTMLRVEATRDDIIYKSFLSLSKKGSNNENNSTSK